MVSELAAAMSISWSLSSLECLELDLRWFSSFYVSMSLCLVTLFLRALISLLVSDLSIFVSIEWSYWSTGSLLCFKVFNSLPVLLVPIADWIIEKVSSSDEFEESFRLSLLRLFTAVFCLSVSSIE